MKIYLDLIFILNFLFDLLLIISLGLLLSRQSNLKKVLASSLFGSISIFILFIISNTFLTIICKLIISFIMVIIAYGYKSISYSLKNMFYLYTISIFLGGCLYLFNIEVGYTNSGLLFYNNGLKVNLLFLLILSPIVIFIYIKSLKKLKCNYNNYYQVDIYLDNNEVYSLTGFLDSGNNIYDIYKNRPVILVDKSKIKIDYKKHKLVLVPISTINDNYILKCIVPKKIYINNVGTRTNFLVGISDKKINIDGVDCILHHKLIEKGVL